MPRTLTRSYLCNLLLFILVNLVTVENQESISKTVTSQASNSISNTTTDNSPISLDTTTVKAPSTTIGGEILLSSNDFVDFTESPTILFDGTSNESNNETTQDTPETNSSFSSRVPNGGISTTSASPEANGTETTTTTDSASESDPSDDNSEDDDSPMEASGHTKPLELPQNVSQYMDYIEQLFHDLRHQITDLFEPHIPQLIRTSQMVELSGPCSYDMLRMALALRQFEPWALRMIDSSGKVPEGIFEGSFTALGSYDECLNTVFASSASANPPVGQQDSQQTSVSPTQGKYCLVNVSPFLPPKPPADRVERMFQEEANRRNYSKDDQFSRLSPMFYYMKFRIGVCVPSTCADSDVSSISDALSSSLRLNITIPNCRIKQTQPITRTQLIGGIVFASVLATVIGATLMDYSKRRLNRSRRKEIVMISISSGNKDKLAPTKVPVLLPRIDHETLYCKKNFKQDLNSHWSWMSFSLITNYKLYFKHKSSISMSRDTTLEQSQRQLSKEQTNNVQHDPLVIRCLDGIRVLSLCWVVIANSYITLDPRATKRLTKTREAPKDFLFQTVAQASLAIETFFFLSGVLLSLSFVRKLRFEKQEAGQVVQPSRALRWIHFYVHRYVRMTPATMLVIALTMFAYHYGDGPLWFEATHKSHQSCSQNWWRHLLHVANFIDTRQMCFIHYWYIAADMQLFLFAPILMFLLYKYRRIGYTIAAFIGAYSITSVFYTTYVQNLPPTLLFYNSDPESRREFGNLIMTKPLTHALPYMVGMLVGKWLTSSDRISLINRQSNNRSLATLTGLVATLVALAEVFLPYKWNNSHLPTRFLAALYAALFRFAWSLVLAHLVVSCGHRRGKRCRNTSYIMTNATEQHGCSCKQGPMSKSLWNSGTPIQESNLLEETTAEPIVCFCGSGGSLLNRLLGLNIFAHLSRLSFVAYLIHIPLMSVFIAQTRGLFAFSHTLVIHLALSYLVMTFILSFVLVHIIEFPFLTFEKYSFERLLYYAGINEMKHAINGSDHFYTNEGSLKLKKSSSSSATAEETRQADVCQQTNHNCEEVKISVRL